MTIVEARPSSLLTGVEAAPSRELHKPLIPLSIANLTLRRSEGRVGIYIRERTEYLRGKNEHLLDSIQNLATNAPYRDAPIAYLLSTLLVQNMANRAIDVARTRSSSNTLGGFPKPNPQEYEERIFGRWGSPHTTRQKRRVVVIKEMEVLAKQEPHLNSCIKYFADPNPDSFDIVYAGALDMFGFVQSHCI